MRKIILQGSVSVDGYFEGPNHELDWNMVDEELHTHFNRHLATMSAFLEGRVTYELMRSYWPTADQNPEASPAEIEYAGIWREMPKIVFSKTLEQVGPNATLVREVVPEEIARLKARPGGDMTMSGAGLAATFLRHGLIDEYLIYVHPVVLGAGNPLFPPGTDMRKLRLAETRTFGNGVVMLRYQNADTAMS